MRTFTMRMLRRTLDEQVPELKGVPRTLVATEEGRAAVEQWLRKGEQRGLPPDAPGGRMLDLDPLRRELGMPTVIEQL